MSHSTSYHNAIPASAVLGFSLHFLHNILLTNKFKDNSVEIMTQMISLLAQYGAAAHAWTVTEWGAVPVLSAAAPPFITKLLWGACSVLIAALVVEVIMAPANIAQKIASIVKIMGEWVVDIASGSLLSRSMFARHYIRDNAQEDEQALRSLLVVVEGRKSSHMVLTDLAIQPPLSFSQIKEFDGLIMTIQGCKTKLVRKLEHSVPS